MTAFDAAADRQGRTSGTGRGAGNGAGGGAGRGPGGRAIENIYPLTALQQGMLFHTELADEPGMYWVQDGLLMEGELDLDALRRAWELMFARHEVLRTTVVRDGVAEPLAVVSRSVPLPLRVVDLSHLDEAARRVRLDDYLTSDWEQGADFTAPTLARIAVLRLAADRHQLVWSYHHLLLDGWSAPIVIGELLQAYDAFRTGDEPRLPARRPFRDFVAWFAAQDMDEARAYWRRRLAGSPSRPPSGSNAPSVSRAPANPRCHCRRRWPEPGSGSDWRTSRVGTGSR